MTDEEMKNMTSPRRTKIDGKIKKEIIQGIKIKQPIKEDLY